MKPVLFSNNIALSVTVSQCQELPDFSAPRPILSHPTSHLQQSNINSKYVRIKPSIIRCRLEKHSAQAEGTFHLFKCFYLKKKKFKDLHGTTSSQHSYVLVIPITIQLQPINQGGEGGDF